MRNIIVASALGLILAAVVAVPGLAISYGTVDTAGDGVDVGNVGALIALDEQGNKVVFCSGTLISPTVFLTAAHCMDADGQRMWVSFDFQVEEPVTQPPTTLLPGTAHPHPDYRCCANAGPFDIAVVELDAAVVGITPAPLPPVGLLDELGLPELRDTPVLTSGYGLARETRRKAGQSLFFDGQRRWAWQSVKSLNRDWLTLSMNQSTGNGGTCFGDSGGPHFIGRQVVTITITGDSVCKSSDKTYRLDTPSSLAFIADFL